MPGRMHILPSMLPWWKPIDPRICHTLCSKLTWSHNRLIMRVEDLAARTYYLLNRHGAYVRWNEITLRPSAIPAGNWKIKFV
jgi:hypothetical protein